MTNGQRKAAKQRDKHRVTHLVDLATALAGNWRDQAIHRTLCEVVRSLLAESRDDLLDEATAHAPHAAGARVIRTIAEFASERVQVVHDGVDTELCLVALPVVVSFAEELAESQFDAVMQRLWSPKLASNLKAHAPGLQLVSVLPEFFRLRSLRSIPLSAIRRSAAALGAAGDAISSPLPSAPVENRNSGSSAYLRYVVGQRVMVHGERIYPTPVACNELQQLIAQSVKAQLGADCEVSAFYAGAFHGPLYDGMWLYQEKRIDQVAHAAKSQVRSSPHGLTARLGAGHSSPHDITLAFFSSGALITGRCYLISTRPGDLRSDSMRRIENRIAAAGIPIIPELAGTNSEPGMGGAEPTIPI